MELDSYITKGAEIVGTMKALAERLGVSATDASNAKAKRRGLPDYACVKLAQIIEVDVLSVIAASNLATEKNPERREIWLPFLAPEKQTARQGRAVENWRRGSIANFMQEALSRIWPNDLNLTFS